MSNTTVAELITISVTGEPVRGEIVDIVDIVDIDTDESGALLLDVVLRDGRVMKGASALDIFAATITTTAATVAA